MSMDPSTVQFLRRGLGDKQGPFCDTACNMTLNSKPAAFHRVPQVLQIPLKLSDESAYPSLLAWMPLSSGMTNTLPFGQYLLHLPVSLADSLKG